MTFQLVQSFAIIKLYPSSTGIRLIYYPVINGNVGQMGTAFCDLEIPMEAIGDLWATTKTLLQSGEELVHQIPVRDHPYRSLPRVTIYRDAPKSSASRSGACWFHIVDDPKARRIRKIQLSTRDLHSLELACQTATSLEMTQTQTHSQLSPIPAEHQGSRFSFANA